MKRDLLKKVFVPFISLMVLVTTGCDSEPTPTKVLVESISFSTELSSVYVGFDTYITNLKVLPNNATNKDISWSVEDSSIANINENGHVEGLKAGNTKLVATAKDGSNVKKEVNFTVKPLEKPSSWNLETDYCFYVDDSFVPEITMYPNSTYIDKRANFEIIEGKDVLKVDNGRISAYKEGSGVVKVTSVANPELVGNINCVADADRISKYGVKEINGEGRTSIIGKNQDRTSILDFSSPVKKGNWPYLIIKLEDTYNTKDFVVNLDAKQISGHTWYSMRLAMNGSIYSQTEYGAASCGGAPKLDSWTTNTFDYTMHNLEFNQIVICINADIDYQEGKTDKNTEIWFDNLNFAEFVDNPTAISVKESEVLLPLGKQADINVEFAPKYVRNRGLSYKVKEGSESIVSIEDGKLKGLAKGTGYVEVASLTNPDAKCEAKVVVSDDLLISLPVLFNEDINVSHKTNYEGYEVVTSFSKASTSSDAWPGVCYKLPESVAANSIKISLDSKLVSGYNWFSISYCNNGTYPMIDEIGQNPVKDSWTTYDFESSKDSEINTIIIRINTGRVAPDTTTELLFANLRIITK